MGPGRSSPATTTAPDASVNDSPGARPAPARGARGTRRTRVRARARGRPRPAIPGNAAMASGPPPGCRGGAGTWGPPIDLVEVRVREVQGGGGRHGSPRCEARALEAEELPLDTEPPAVATDPSAGGDHAVARDDDRDGIAA